MKLIIFQKEDLMEELRNTLPYIFMPFLKCAAVSINVYSPFQEARKTHNKRFI